jgi:phosphomannomutase/phosphoglucomutase
MSIFREYDIRGRVPSDLHPELARQIGQAFASEMRQRQPDLSAHVLIGRDNRPSSLPLATAFAEGVRATGLNSVDIGEVATPVLYNAAFHWEGAVGVMVTGSHLPPDQNGLKLTQGWARPFFGADIQKLKGRLETSDYLTGQGAGYSNDQASTDYLADLAGRFGESPRRLKIVVDAGNGMGGLYAPTLLRTLGHQVIELYCTPDGTYPNHPADPFEEENLHDLKARVLAEGADLGLAFDGDADRVGFVDGAGNAHATDRALIPLIFDLLKRKPAATIIVDSLVSTVLIATIEGAGGQVVLCKSGHSNIKTKMAETQAAFGLETSGHVFIADDYYGYDDGIYTALRMVEILARPNTAPLATIMAEIPHLHTTPQFRPACPEDQKAPVIEALARAFARYNVSRVDGVRVTLPEGWFICRPSNTEAKLSLRFEAQTPAALESILTEVGGILADFGLKLR